MRQVRPARPGPRGPGECPRVPPRAPAGPRSDSASLRRLAAGSSLPGGRCADSSAGGCGRGCGRGGAAAAPRDPGLVSRCGDRVRFPIAGVGRFRLEAGKRRAEQAPRGPSVRMSPLFPCLLRDLLRRNRASPLPLWMALTPSSASAGKHGRRLTPSAPARVGPKPLARRQKGASSRGNSLKKSWPRNESFHRREGT